MAFISVHMIVKENTNLGVRFLNTCLEALAISEYPDELVIVDNGSIPAIFDLYTKYTPRFPSVKVIKSIGTDFTTIRNTCLAHTNPKADYWHWIDSDEVYYPEDLDTLKHTIVGDRLDIRQVWTYFWHFMIHPWQIQAYAKKDNFFKFTPNVFWHGGVHEHVAGLPVGDHLDSNCQYLHYGYARQQWRTCLKWLHYDHIQWGHLNGYKLENIEQPDKSIIQKDWFRDWRYPDNILQDRQDICKPYPGPPEETRDYVPDCIKDILLAPAKGFDKPITPETWNEFVNFIDPHEFWSAWQDKHKEVGNWKDTLDWVQAEMVKCDWKV